MVKTAPPAPRTTPRRLLLALRLSPILFTPLAACAPPGRGEDAPDTALVTTAASPVEAHGEGELDPGDVAEKERFGHAVALSGNTALVGAYRSPASTHQGAAWVFVKDALWTRQAKLLAEDPAPSQYFGVSVALRDDTALVGAPGHGPAGSAHVFTRNGVSWELESMLSPSDGAPGDHFGRSVALGGDVAFASGAQKPEDTGAVYVFSRTGSEWTEVQKLVPDDAQPGDFFGRAIAFSGDTLVIGAHTAWNGDEQGGAVYVFVQEGSTFVQRARLTPPPGWGEHFGSAVSISGDTIVVGAWAVGTTGGAYVSERRGDAWSAPARLPIAKAKFQDYIGLSVAVEGDFLAVGAPYRDEVDVDAGAVYLFERKLGTWQSPYGPNLFGATAEDNFGYSLAMQGGRLIAGAPRADTWAKESGAAYAFHLPLEVGQPCTDHAGCVSGSCVEGVCCDEICIGKGLSCPGGHCVFTPEGGTGGEGGQGGGGQAGGGGGGASTTFALGLDTSAPAEERSFYSCRTSPGGTGSIALAATSLLAGLTARRRRRQGPSRPR